MGHPFEDEVQSFLELLHLGYLSAFVTIVKLLIPNLLTLEPLKFTLRKTSLSIFCAINFRKWLSKFRKILFIFTNLSLSNFVKVTFLDDENSLFMRLKY